MNLCRQKAVPLEQLEVICIGKAEEGVSIGEQEEGKSIGELKEIGLSLLEGVSTKKPKGSL